MTTDTVPKTAWTEFQAGGENLPAGGNLQGIGNDSPQHGHHAVLHHHRLRHRRQGGRGLPPPVAANRTLVVSLIEPRSPAAIRPLRQGFPAFRTCRCAGSRFRRPIRRRRRPTARTKRLPCDEASRPGRCPGRLAYLRVTLIDRVRTEHARERRSRQHDDARACSSWVSDRMWHLSCATDTRSPRL